MLVNCGKMAKFASHYPEAVLPAAKSKGVVDATSQNFEYKKNK
jgi:hypothetical protein